LASRGFWHIHIPSDYFEVPSERSSASLLAKQIAAEQRNERREQLRLVDSIGRRLERQSEKIAITQVAAKR
jgi:hypothetical protein